MNQITLILSTIFTFALCACDVQNLSKQDPASGVVVQNDIALELDQQEVVRLGCGGLIRSDAIETVSAPTHWVTINPSNPSDVISSTFYDEQTSATAVLMLGFNEFHVDYSYGALNMHVASGANVIDYSFTRCTQFVTSGDDTHYCPQANQIVSESGKVNIYVTYTQKTLPGKMTIDECPPPVNP